MAGESGAAWVSSGCFLRVEARNHSSLHENSQNASRSAAEGVGEGTILRAGVLANAQVLVVVVRRRKGIRGE
jgi:hypothetical protein